MNLDEEIINRDLSDLLTYFSKQTYSASGCDEQVNFCFLIFKDNILIRFWNFACQAERILDRCVDLFLKDYDISVSKYIFMFIFNLTRQAVCPVWNSLPATVLNLVFAMATRYPKGNYINNNRSLTILYQLIC